MPPSQLSKDQHMSYHLICHGIKFEIIRAIWMFKLAIVVAFVVYQPMSLVDVSNSAHVSVRVFTCTGLMSCDVICTRNFFTKNRVIMMIDRLTFAADP